MVLMAIVDAQYQFLLCDFGTNGRVSDGGVLQNMKFFEMLRNNQLEIPSEKAVRNSQRRLPHVFVSDDAFPLRPDMVKPFRQAELTSTDKKIYNLASRFRIFHTAINLHPNIIESVVMACCAFYNYLIRKLPNSYTNPDCFDREDYDTGTIIPGCTTDISTMEPLERRNVGNISRTPKKIREEFMNRFNNEGQVPWQNNFI